MKNKKRIYLLLALVIAIWGMIIYQFLGYSTASTEDIPTQNFSLLPEINYTEPDTTAIHIDYRDPFSGKLDQKNEKPVAIVSNGNKNYATKIDEEKETVINYKGIVSDLNDKIKVFMIIIDGNTYLMKQGDVEEDVKLIKGNRESITIKHRGKLNTIAIVE